MKIKNKPEYNIRLIKLEDYSELKKWWKLYELQGIVIPKKSRLPNNGLGGFVVEKENKLIASAFLYLTNSTLGYVDYLIADPNYREEDRQQVLLDLASMVTSVAIENGCDAVWAYTCNQKLVDMAVDANAFKILPQDYKIVYTYDKN